MHHDWNKHLHCWIEIIYVSRRGAITQRTVYVQRVTGSVLIAFCAERKAPRRFRMENILSFRQVIRCAG